MKEGESKKYNTEDFYHVHKDGNLSFSQAGIKLICYYHHLKDLKNNKYYFPLVIDDEDLNNFLKKTIGFIKKLPKGSDIKLPIIVNGEYHSYSFFIEKKGDTIIAYQMESIEDSFEYLLSKQSPFDEGIKYKPLLPAIQRSSFGCKIFALKSARGFFKAGSIDDDYFNPNNFKLSQIPLGEMFDIYKKKLGEKVVKYNDEISSQYSLSGGLRSTLRNHRMELFLFKYRQVVDNFLENLAQEDLKEIINEFEGQYVNEGLISRISQYQSSGIPVEVLEKKVYIPEVKTIPEIRDSRFLGR